MANPTDRGAAGEDNSSLESIEIFSNAFDEATGEGTSGTDGTSGVATGDVSDFKGELPENSDTTQSTMGTQAVSGTAGTSGTVSADDEKAEQKYRTLQGILKAEKDKWEQEKAVRDAEIERLRAAGTAGRATQTQTFDDPYMNLSEEDKKALKEYDTEYDTVSKFEAIKRKAELAALEGKLTTSIRKEFQEAFNFLIQSMAPVLSTTEQISDERHFGAIKNKHADFEKYRDDGSIETWINSKPKYLRDAYVSVYNDGSAQDIIDLLDTFKKENNIGPPVVTDAAGTAGTSADLKHDKEKKKEALAGVHSKRTPTNYSQLDKDDYAGAFDEAAKKLST